MSTAEQPPSIESAIPPHLLDPARRPKHRPGTYTPPYPSFSARFDQKVTAVVMAYLGVQARDPSDPRLVGELGALREALAREDGPVSWDRAAYTDAEGYYTVISIAYWDDPAAFREWNRAHGEPWIAPGHPTEGLGFFLELVLPSIERVETVFSAPERPEGVAGTAYGFSGTIEEHFYWGSARDRLPAAQRDPLWADGDSTLTETGPVRSVVLHRNACLIRSGQDITETGPTEREFYLAEVEPVLREGMDFLVAEGATIGCLDNRYMTVLDEADAPTDRTFGMSWWRELSALEEWAASHPSHLRIYGAGMRHLSGFGGDTRLRLYHEVTVPSGAEQRFVYAGCHDRTGVLKAVR
ncbi:phenylacetaldoxime dehydratase family protein [Tsukamurella hominis]|uniref:phenylacetaldoxime dehydratase family protein n=1 Tax=Tsukamurella hominis TaxID=1970232 RepID=UPI0039EA6C82